MSHYPRLEYKVGQVLISVHHFVDCRKILFSGLPNISGKSQNLMLTWELVWRSVIGGLIVDFFCNAFWALNCQWRWIFYQWVLISFLNFFYLHTKITNNIILFKNSPKTPLEKAVEFFHFDFEFADEPSDTSLMQNADVFQVDKNYPDMFITDSRGFSQVKKSGKL